MKKILKVHNVNDYAQYIGAPMLHPLVSVIHYDELEHCRHSLNNYDVYGIFIGDETLEKLTYGLTTYDLHRHALMCVAPGQIGGKADTGEEIQTKGWALLFDPELLNGTDLERRMPSFTYFSYNTNEALLMTAEQRSTIVKMMEAVRKELLESDDENTRHGTMPVSSLCKLNLQATCSRVLRTFLIVIMPKACTRLMDSLLSSIVLRNYFSRPTILVT